MSDHNRASLMALWRIYCDGEWQRLRTELLVATTNLEGRDLAFAYTILADLECHEGRQAEAIRAYELAEACDPSDQGAKCVTAKSLLDDFGDLGSCMRKLSEVNAPGRMRDVDRYLYYSLMAVCEVRNGRLAGAAQYMLKAAEVSNVVAFFQGHEAFRELCQKKAQLDACREYLRLLANALHGAKEGDGENGDPPVTRNAIDGAREIVDRLRRLLPSVHVQ